MSREDPLFECWSRLLSEVGVDTTNLVFERFDPKNFGDGEIVFAVGSFIVRLTRERGQDFVDLGAATQPGKYFRVDDVFVALGLRELDDVTKRDQPVALKSELEAIVRNCSLVETALASPGWQQRLNEASHAREQAFLAKLAKLAANNEPVN